MTEDSVCKTNAMAGKKFFKMGLANIVKNIVDLMESIFMNALPLSVNLDNIFFQMVLAKTALLTQEVFPKSFVDQTHAIACRF